MLRISAIIAAVLALTAVAQVPIPARPDGYRYAPLPNRSAPLQLHGYFDLTCPDCKVSHEAPVHAGRQGGASGRSASFNPRSAASAEAN